MLRLAGSLSCPRQPLSRGSNPASHPAKPLVSYRTHRHLSGWNLPPREKRAYRAHTGTGYAFSISIHPPSARLSPPFARPDAAAELRLDPGDEIFSAERAPIPAKALEPVERRLLVERQFQEIGEARSPLQRRTDRNHGQASGVVSALAARRIRKKLSTRPNTAVASTAMTG